MAQSSKDFDIRGKQHILIQGLPGTGKTTLALQFPKPYLIDVDNNLAGAIQGNLVKDLEFKWDSPILDAEGKPLEPVKNPVGYEDRFRAIFDEALNDPEVETVILDSATAVTQIFCASIPKRNNKQHMELQLWQVFIKYWLDMILIAKSKGKRFILIAHEEMVKDDMDGGMKRMLLLPTRARALIPGMFSDIWECYTETRMSSGIESVMHKIRVKADNRVSSLKASHPMAKPVFEATWAEVQKILIETKATDTK